MDASAILCRGYLRIGDGSRTVLSAFRMPRALLHETFRQRFFGLVAFDGKPSSISPVVEERHVMLIWMADEPAFESWLATAQPGRIEGTLAIACSNIKTACLGFLPASGIQELRETLRLDLPKVTAVELVTTSRTMLLCSDSKAELVRWEGALLAFADAGQQPGHRNSNRMSHAAERRASAIHNRRGSNRMSLRRRSTFTPAGLVTFNKWKFEVTTALFRFLLLLLLGVSLAWPFALIWLMNPYLAGCISQDGRPTFAHSNSSHCYTATADGSVQLVDGCRAWRAAAQDMGGGLSWVSHLQTSGLLPRAYVLEGEVQSCFRTPNVGDLFVYWLFVAAEIISVLSTIAVNLLNWRVMRRGAKPLHKLQPPLPTTAYPSVDVLICHYSEPAEETVATLQKALSLEYPPSKLHIYICDDGRLKSDFKAVDGSGSHWPAAKLNQGCIQQSGDTREVIADFMEAQLGVSDDQPRPIDAHKTTREVLPAPDEPARVVPRIDCAVGFIEDRYEVPGMPKVSYVARLKPKVHHSKSGNINNVLYNVQAAADAPLQPPTEAACAPGRYVAIFDNDMEPHPLFLVSVLSLFFEPYKAADRHSRARWFSARAANMPPQTTASRSYPPGVSRDDCSNDLQATTSPSQVQQEAIQIDGLEMALPASTPAPPGGSTWTDEPEDNVDNLAAGNKLAFVQTPQYFKRDELVDEFGDPLAHSNATFMDVALPGMDTFDSAMFIGTNCVWRRAALDSIGGLQYGTISEDFWTGRHAHQLGWLSAYLRKDHLGDPDERFRLSEGTVPPNVAASLAQRKRWHKGAVELALGVDNPVDALWAPQARYRPSWRLPRSVRLFRSFHWHYITKFSWLATTIPAPIYTFICCFGCWTNDIFLFLNPMPAAIFMLPRLLLSAVVPTLANPHVSTASYLISATEFFVYWPVKLVGTLEAFYSKVTGKAAKWGNTGGIGSGSVDELPVVLCVLALTVSLLRSMVVWMFVDTHVELYRVLPVWGFGTVMLGMYWPFARTSIQEWAGYSYYSLNGSLLWVWLFSSLLMGSTLLMQQRENGAFG